MDVDSDVNAIHTPVYVKRPPEVSLGFMVRVRVRFRVGRPLAAGVTDAAAGVAGGLFTYTVQMRMSNMDVDADFNANHNRNPDPNPKPAPSVPSNHYPTHNIRR